jgi:LuxR family maltose regulon positive regulatory protein
MNVSAQDLPAQVGKLWLQVTPPREPRHLIMRARLVSTAEPLRESPLILVKAPAGFGKTSLLSQWRREQLSHGTVVAWFSAQGNEDPWRLLQALVLSMRQAAARPAFGRVLLDASIPNFFEGIATWLADVAQAAMDTVLIVDEADRLSADALHALVYLMRNAPANLRVMISARSEIQLDIEDLVDYGQCLVIGPLMLRFELDETLALVGARMGVRINHDSVARLHEMVEGWPLGIQLALAACCSGPDPQAELELITQSGILQEQMVGLLLTKLAPDDVAFLERIAILDHLQPELCVVVAGEDSARERLSRLVRDTPIFTLDEHGGWLRMHQLARDTLHRRLPVTEQAELHARAAGWLADNGLLESAGRHALLCGQREWAYDLAERCLYEDLMEHGRHGTVLKWLERLPPEALDRRPRLLLAAAWTLAASGRHAEGAKLAERILEQPHIDDVMRCECELILIVAADFSGEPDRYTDLSSPWADTSLVDSPIVAKLLRSMCSYWDLIRGEPALARLRLEHAPAGDFGSGHHYAERWGEYIVGFAYLREGQVLMAERQLRTTLARAEADFGRRSPFACMVAAVYATTLWEMDRPADARTALANRCDVIDHSVHPEVVGLASRTMARIALADGAEHQALQLLDALYAVGVARSLPRLCIASMVEQVRLHARKFRAITCQQLVVRLETFLSDAGLGRGPLWWHDVSIHCDLAKAYSAIAARDWRLALDVLQRGSSQINGSGAMSLHIEFLGLRALALDRRGEDAQAMLREAADLAKTYGLRRVFADSHPALVDLISQLESLGAAESAAFVSPTPLPPLKLGARPSSTKSVALTPKEREVLQLLARNLSNKEIGLAMRVSDQAIKWHLKNLFAKLDAGSRKHLVQRSRMLGLLQDEVDRVV